MERRQDGLRPQVMPPITDIDVWPNLAENRPGVDFRNCKMDRRTDALRLPLDQRPEVGRRAAVVGREPKMHIHDAPGKEIEQRRTDDAGAEQYDDVRAPLPEQEGQGRAWLSAKVSKLSRRAQGSVTGSRAANKGGS